MKDLTEVAEWSTPITVPEGMDTRNHAAEDVESIAQRLANRTQFIDAMFAKLSRANVFTDGPQTINLLAGVVDAPVLTTQGKPEDALLSDGTPVPGNRWKLLIAAPTKGDAWSGIFVGQPPDGAAFVNNARWHVPTQMWRQLDPAYPSTGLIGRSGQFSFTFMPAGASPWADWPLSAGGDIVAGGNVAAGFDFAYVLPKSHVTRRGIFDGFGEGVLDSTGGTRHVLLTNVGKVHVWPIKLPHGSKLSKVELLMDKAGTNTIELIKAAVNSRTDGLGPPPVLPVDNPLAYPVANSALGPTTLVFDIDPSLQLIDLSRASYNVMLSAVDNGDRIYDIRLTWSEPGVQCYPG